MAYPTITISTLQRDSVLEARLAKELGQTLRGELRAFARVASTMDVAHALAAQGAPEGTLVWSKRQEQGRGRLGRVWESPEGGIYCSLIVRPSRPIEEVPQLSLVSGLALAEAVQACTGLHAAIRWPNDLFIGGKKVAGILVEAKNGAVVIGIGINVTTEATQLPDTATSLSAVGAACDAFQLAAALYSRLLAWYDVWQAKGFASIRKVLRPWMGMFGEVVHISAGSDRLEGTASDLDDSGRLLVRLDSGLMRAFEVGEVSLLT